MEEDVFDNSIKEISEKLNIQPAFFYFLHKEDEWTFIIKIHCILESLLSWIIPEHLKDKRFIDYCKKLGMMKKIQLVTALDIFKNEAKIINGINFLSELRNTLTHDVTNINFSFSDYFKNNPEKKKVFIKIFSYYWKPKVHIKEEILTREEFVKLNPKIAIWFFINQIFALSVLHVKEDELENIYQFSKIVEIIKKFQA